MLWDELVTLLSGRTRRTLGRRAIVVSWFDREIVVSWSNLHAVELATLEIFLCRAERTPGDLAARGAELPLGAPVLVGDRWILRATVPLGGLDAATCEVMARSLAGSAAALTPPPPPAAAAAELFGHLV